MIYVGVVLIERKGCGVIGEEKLKSAILKVDCYGIYELVKVLKDF